MTQPTPSNPLDKYVYPTSDNFTPSMKPQYIGQIGKGTSLDVVKMKSIPIIKLKVFDKVIDVVEDRRNKRTMLINRKATALERSLNDTLEQNEVEMRYRKQKEQMERLANFFANGILSNLYRNVENKAIQDYQRQYLENDTDIADFDEESKKVLETAENVVRLQKQNEELEAKLLRLEQDIQNQLKERAMKAETGEDVEQITQDYADFNRIPKADPIGSVGGASLDDDELLRAEEDLQSRYADSLEDRIEMLEDFERIAKEKRAEPQIGQLRERKETLKFNIQNALDTISNIQTTMSIPLPPVINNIIKKVKQGKYAESSEEKLKDIYKTLSSYTEAILGQFAKLPKE